MESIEILERDSCRNNSHHWEVALLDEVDSIESFPSFINELSNSFSMVVGFSSGFCSEFPESKINLLELKLLDLGSESHRITPQLAKLSQRLLKDAPNTQQISNEANQISIEANQLNISFQEKKLFPTM